jgi:hypothetical protein
VKSLINTQVSFDSDEFNSYEIEKETDITFCLKEFKVCLLFGNWFDLGLEIFFQRKGRPIIFKFNGNNSYEANFTLASLVDDASTSQNTTASMHSNISTAHTTTFLNRNRLNNITNNKNISNTTTRQVSSNVGLASKLSNMSPPKRDERNKSNK